eukprot:m.251774 g.251774  ORF g.251774 m.251774 type:complete len:156 (+) comp40338_c0_seq35:1018-1485(+)
MDRVLGHRPATCPPVLIDSLCPSTFAESSGQPEDILDIGSVEPVGEDTDNPEEGETSPLREKGQRKKKGKKRSRDDRMIEACRSTMKEMCEGIIKMEEEQEEKRMAYDREIRRGEREFEESRRREDRMFQMQMMKMLTNQHHQQPPTDMYNWQEL